eukprot:6200122-Pleurochrysis_carterae.AAC.2
MYSWLWSTVRSAHCLACFEHRTLCGGIVEAHLLARVTKSGRRHTHSLWGAFFTRASLVLHACSFGDVGFAHARSCMLSQMRRCTHSIARTSRRAQEMS